MAVQQEDMARSSKNTNHPAPDRSLKQRMDALHNANIIRSYRANLKLDLKARRANVMDLLSNPPEEIETMKVFDLLISTPKYGRVKANKLLQMCRISSSKTVDGLSDRQRAEVIAQLRRSY